MITIRQVDPADPKLQPLIEANRAHSAGATSSESDHTFGVDDLRRDGVRFWAAFDGDAVLGCGGFKPLPDGTAEVKSVFVNQAARGKGCARKIMDHLAVEASSDGHSALVLETGSELCPEYDAARKLYDNLGYASCPPIYGYQQDPNSLFMRLTLGANS
ncbi:GNAT family N-acetyltransferase [Parasedimentitalea marina]|uniref:GNAT family N-acetyltransferase n=1 Tax=Parasedimentitalea marina TaxID=2483033 RepID=A0A3T0N5T2_9RHOB|nr:GNAT family N-acetyltransferase [Parasedimentitalea marina]AZV79341.1 GNAT family N-acetyltransferase [Parasedimentitalea marina]